MSEIWHNTKIFFGFTANPHDREEKVLQVAARKPTVPGLRGSLVSLPHNKPVSAGEVVVMEPRMYEDSLNIASYVREGKPVIVNLKYLDTKNGLRLIDFVCGTTYAINGHMQRIADNIFLFTPENILIHDADERSNLEKGIENAEKEVFFKRQAAAGL